MENLEYICCGDYYIPALTLSMRPDKPIGKYGRMRQMYLKEHRALLYCSLLMTKRLYSHLLEIDGTANDRLERLMLELMKAAGVTEELKAREPMRCVGLANNCKAQAEEIIQSELIYR